METMLKRAFIPAMIVYLNATLFISSVVDFSNCELGVAAIPTIDLIRARTVGRETDI